MIIISISIYLTKSSIVYISNNINNTTSRIGDKNLNLSSNRNLLLFDKLPAGFGSDVAFVKSSDHYIEVHSPEKKALILMRLSDAISGLAGIDGMQTHRSYWVSQSHVESVIKKNGRSYIVLTTGDQIPIGRTFLPKLREAGWV